MPSRPNILVILADDHAQWALHAYGNSEVRSSNLDFLAETGLLMQNATTPCPVCSPARASFFTGRLPSQHGIHDFIATGSPQFEHGWMEGESTIPQILGDHGYQTGLIGKWHCNTDSSKPQPGFDRWFSYDESAAGWQNQYRHRGEMHFSDQGRPHVEDGFQSRILAREAVSFLRNRDRAQPFFLFYAPVDTHSPHEDHPERHAGCYRDAHFWDVPDKESSHLLNESEWLTFHPDNPPTPQEARAQYYAAVGMIDDQVGILLDELDSTGDLDNTLVVYTADHGYMIGQHGLWGKGNSTRPQNFYEEAIRVPCIFRWPERIPDRRLLGVPFDHCDMLSTLLDAANVQLPSSVAEKINSPGQNLFARLRSEGPDWREYRYCEFGPARMITDGKHKLIRRYPPHAGTWPDEFFDLATDPRESTNRINHAPFQGRIASLTQEIEAHFSRYEDPARSVKNLLNQPPCNFSDKWWPRS